jgi:urea transport system substrate-binding protein
VLNTLNGSSNQAFFRALSRAGIKAEQIPVMSLSIAEVELEPLLPEAEGHFATWSYFESLNSAKNRRFLGAFRSLTARDGKPDMADDPIQTAYWQVLAYAQAVNRCGNVDPVRVREAARGLILEAPEGLVRIDPRNFHTWKVARIGQIMSDRQFRIVWSSEIPIRPEPLVR